MAWHSWDWCSSSLTGKNKTKQHSAKTNNNNKKTPKTKPSMRKKKNLSITPTKAQTSPRSLPPLWPLKQGAEREEFQPYLVRRFEWISLSTYSTTDTEPKARILLYPHTKLGRRKRNVSTEPCPATAPPSLTSHLLVTPQNGKSRWDIAINWKNWQDLHTLQWTTTFPVVPRFLHWF